MTRSQQPPANRSISELLVAQSREVQCMRGEMAKVGIRYISLIETKRAEEKASPLDGVWCVGRVNGGALHTVYRLVAFSPERQSRMYTLILTDTGVGANLDISYDVAGRAVVALGGGSDAHHSSGPGISARWEARGRNFTLSPIELLPVERGWQRILDGAWLSRGPRWQAVMPSGETHHAGCIDEHATPSCGLDGKFSVVKFRGQWLTFARANLLSSGGRSVQVMRSAGPDPRGPFGPFEQLQWQGFELLRPLAANIYFAAVRVHPTDAGLLLGLFPVNTGQPNTPNGNRGGHIALALSCDGVRWSALRPLVGGPGGHGRTYDHPVSGFVYFRSALHLYVQHDVGWISPFAESDGHVREYTLKPGVLERLSAEARASLPSCEQAAAGAPSDFAHGPAPRGGPNDAEGGAERGSRGGLDGAGSALALPSAGRASSALSRLWCGACLLVRSRWERECSSQYRELGDAWAEYCSCGCCRDGMMQLSHVVQVSCSELAAPFRRLVANSKPLRRLLIRHSLARDYAPDLHKAFRPRLPDAAGQRSEGAIGAAVPGVMRAEDLVLAALVAVLLTGCLAATWRLCRRAFARVCHSRRRRDSIGAAHSLNDEDDASARLLSPEEHASLS